MVDLFIPEQGFDKNLSDNYYDIAKTGTLDVLGASFQETLYYNPANALSRTIEQYVGPGTQGKILSKDEWSNSDYYRDGIEAVSYTHLRAHETRHDLVCRLLLEKKKDEETFR